MAHILIVEDEHPISNLIKMSLKKSGHECECAFDGIQAADMIEQKHFDLILLDVNLPEADGYTLLDYIKPHATPVIFITARGELSERIKGLNAGAEDYIVKPFEVAELIARVDVVLRRYHKSDDQQLQVDDIMIDPRSRTVTRDGEEIAITKTEFDLIRLFAEHPGRALTREYIYEQVWGGEFPYGSKTVDLQVQRMRKKLGLEHRIVSVNKVGYRLED